MVSLPIFVLGRLLLVATAIGGTLTAQATSRPNLVFLFTDDQAVDTLGCYGNEDVSTPNIDGLAADGVTFDNHYVSTAICMPSRATVMTGRHEFRHGCNFSSGPLLQRYWDRSYPVLLRENGYRTAIAGKIGFVVADQPKGKGILPKDDFDAFAAGPGQTSYVTAKNPALAPYAEAFPHATRAYGAFGSDFIAASAEARRPFCLSISFKAPHRPTTPDPRDDGVYRGKKFRKPGNYGRAAGDHLAPQSREGRQYPRFESWGYADRFDEVMATYHQQIYAIDAAVGMIRKALDDHGVADNTVVIFTSDHGFLCGSHGYGSKVLPYEESVRAPLIVFDPREPNSGKKLRSSALTGNVDFAPTLLALAGVGAPKGMDGRDLMPIYRDPGRGGHEALPILNVWGPTATYYLGVVTQEAKYVYWPYAKAGFAPTEELFDLARDPLEMTQLAGKEDDDALMATMRRHYDAIVERWRTDGVPHHGYPRFATLFGR